MPSPKRYSDEFKREAIQLITEQHLARKQVARDLGMDVQTLRRWLREQDQEPAPAASGASAEVARLRRENDLLRQERDMLKKALGSFSRMP